LALLGFVLVALPASAYTPDDEVVIEMVDQGVKFLETSGNNLSRYGPGVRVLKAYAHYKVMHDPTVAVVKTGVEQAIQFANAYSNSPNLRTSTKAVYEASVSILLLAAVGPIAYHSHIVALRDFLYSVQYDNGAFGYAGYATGDVSQVQYAMLAFWTLQQADFDPDRGRVGDCVDWLLRVQDPSGAWPYQGTDPGPGKPLRSQKSEVGMSMALAGGSAALIGGDVLGMWGRKVENDASKLFKGMPDAVKIPTVNKRIEKAPAKPKTRVVNAIKLCEGYRARTPFERKHWYYYQLYTLERYESFLEIAFQRPPADSPDWYNRGVEELRGYQSPEGAWGLKDKDKTAADNSTAFAILFLIRSTQSAISTASSGTLGGGQGLPKDTTDIRVTGTKIQGRPVAAEVGQMLDLLEDDAGDLEGKSIPDDLKLAADPKERRAQLDRLQRLVRGSQSWQARRVAARLLGKSEQMDVVPALIYALSDKDKSVRRYARDGLRFISRKFDGYGLSDQPTDAEVEVAQERWRQWYLTVNPKYVFLDR
jgi:hypothetical protein